MYRLSTPVPPFPAGVVAPGVVLLIVVLMPALVLAIGVRLLNGKRTLIGVVFAGGGADLFTSSTQFVEYPVRRLVLSSCSKNTSATLDAIRLTNRTSRPKAGCEIVLP